MAVAVVVAPLVGLLVAQGPRLALLVAAALCVTILAARPRISRRARSPHPVAFGLVTLGLFFMPFNALRLRESVTVSDAILLAAGMVFIAGAVARASKRELIPPIPAWLLIGAAGLVVTALLAELFPPGATRNMAQVAGDSLYAQNDPNAMSSDTAAASNAVVAVRWTATLLGVPLLLGLLANTWQRLRLLVQVWVVAAALNCVVALTNWLGILSAADIVGRDYALLGGTEADRFVGLTVHPTQLGTISAMALPLVLARLANRLRAQDIVLTTLLALGIMLSGSRAAVLGVAVGIAAMILIRGRLRPRISTVAFCGGFVAITAAVTNGGGFATVARLSTGSGSAAVSDASRANTYAETFHAIVERPFVGYGYDVVRVGHSLYLGILQAGGVIALACFICLAVGQVRSGLVLARDSRLAQEWQVAAVGLTGAAASWLALSLVQNTVFDRFLYIPAGLVIALAYNARQEFAASTVAVSGDDPALDLSPGAVNVPDGSRLELTRVPHLRPGA